VTNAATNKATKYWWSVVTTGTAVLSINGNTLSSTPISTTGASTDISFDTFHNGDAAIVSVYGTNDCGDDVKSLVLATGKITSNNPAAPGAFIASSSDPVNQLCGTHSNLHYTFALAATTSLGAATKQYSWTLSDNSVGSFNTNPTTLPTSDLNLNLTSSVPTVNVLVYGMNSCGLSAAKSQPLSSIPVTAPGPITVVGAPGSLPCSINSVITFHTDGNGDPNSSYSWTIPGNTVIVSQNDNNPTGSTIDVKLLKSFSAGTAFTVKVTPVACGLKGGSLTVTGATFTLCGASGRAIEETAAAATDQSVTVYPNPASDHASLIFNAASAASYKLILMDVTGRQVMTKQGEAAEGFNQIDFSLNNLPKGVYMVNFSSNDQNKTIRLVVQ
jgi:hypothetical protein